MVGSGGNGRRQLEGADGGMQHPDDLIDKW